MKELGGIRSTQEEDESLVLGRPASFSWSASVELSAQILATMTEFFF